MGNTKQKLWKNILVIGILSAILLSGCGKENVPKEEPLKYKDCSAVLVERKENDGTVDEIFTLDITYLSGQPESDEPEHFIADMKASYPADNPEDITLWMDNSGGAMTDFTLFKECGPG